MKGLVYIFTGNGKGKTTASVGILLRACGHGMKSCLIQFMKESKSGEIAALKKLGIETVIGGAGFYKIRGDKNPPSKHKEKARKTLILASKKILSGNYDMIVLDEIITAISVGLLSEKKILGIFKKRPASGPHLILTGRNASKNLLKQADGVSEVKEIKHPFKKGILAQKGLEF